MAQIEAIADMRGHSARMRSLDCSPKKAQFIRIAKRLKRCMEEGIAPWSPKAKYRDVFLLGGITHVPNHEFPDHIDFFMATANMLRFRYGLNPQFALLDNEVSLEGLPKKMRPYSCYALDQGCTQLADFIIFDISVPTTGGGQEAERARQAKVPIIGMAKEEIREQVTPPVFYEAITNSGERVMKKVHRGVSSISLMVEGNPCLIDFFAYANNGHVGRSEALIMLDEKIRKHFSLPTIESEIREKIQRLRRIGISLAEKTIGKQEAMRFLEEESRMIRASMNALEKDCDPGLGHHERAALEVPLSRQQWLMGRVRWLGGGKEANGNREVNGLIKGLAEYRIEEYCAQIQALEGLLGFPHPHSTFYYQRMFPDSRRIPLADRIMGKTESEIVEVRALRREALFEPIADQINAPNGEPDNRIKG